MNELLDTIGAISIVVGTALNLAAAIGLVRFPDLLSRIHSATKPQTLGMLLILAGIALNVRTIPAFTMLTVVAIMQLITAPISAHMVSRTAVRSNPMRKDLLLVDEFHDD